MDNTAQNNAIAHYCTTLRPNTHIGDPDYFYWKTPGGDWMPKLFTSDLNDMHEAEKVLTEEQKDSYEYILVGINRRANHIKQTTQLRYTRSSTYATAAQRAEAFLKTLNLWDNQK